MNQHEYQAKGLLEKFGVPVLPGFLAYTAREAQKAAVNLGGETVVVKAQVHAGGRGKAGGVKLAHSPEEVRKVAGGILGMRLVTPQTGSEGKLVRKVWVEKGAEIAREFYLSLLVDRTRGSLAFVCSEEGGMEIEEVAAKSPERILQVNVPTETGLQGFHCRRIAKFLSISKSSQKAFFRLLENLYRAFRELDLDLLEINPLIETKEGALICLDAKLSVDSNALFRQREAFELMDYEEIDDREIAASELGISYVALDGNIGCMVNGAGLAMATMDIIQQAGGAPANFLDVGGGASREKVTGAFELILQDDAVKGILVNIFGGIMRCDIIAEGIIEAAKTLDIHVPLVVRLQGTNVERGRELLEKSGLKIIPAESMGEAARLIVEAVA